MTALAATVGQWLTREGHRLCGRECPPAAVRLRPAGTVFLATLAFADGPRQLVVKQLPTDANLPDPAALCEVHRRVRARDPRLARDTPAFLGHDAEHRLLAMEFIPGATLRDVLGRALWLPGWREAACRELLEGAADLLAAVHRLSADELGVPYPVRPNRSFLPDLEGYWTDRRLAALLPAGWGDPERLYRALPGSFFERAAANLVLVDAQPKNAMVPQPGRVCWIDLDYLGGNPAVGVAHFLVSLDRLGLRHPLGSAGRLAGWKQCFLDRYARAAPEAAAEVVFFYPRALLGAAQGHAAYRPASRWYLLRYYGRRLREFLANLARRDPSPAGVPLTSLFAAAA